MRRDEVPDEQENAHDDVLSDRDDVGARDLEHFDTLLHSRIQVDVVGANTSGDTDFEVLSLSRTLSIRADRVCIIAVHTFSIRSRVR